MPRSAPTEFLTSRQVQDRYQRSHMTIWRWTKDADLGFPRPIQVRGQNLWRLSDLEAWEAKMAEVAAA